LAKWIILIGDLKYINIHKIIIVTLARVHKDSLNHTDNNNVTET